MSSSTKNKEMTSCTKNKEMTSSTNMFNNTCPDCNQTDDQCDSCRIKKTIDDERAKVEEETKRKTHEEEETKRLMHAKTEEEVSQRLMRAKVEEEETKRCMHAKTEEESTKLKMHAKTEEESTKRHISDNETRVEIEREHTIQKKIDLEIILAKAKFHSGIKSNE